MKNKNKPLNRVLSVTDYEGYNHRKAWETELAEYALKKLGAVHAEAEILGVGAGKETTIFNLSTQVKRVWATDLYLIAGDWHAHAPVEMLITPERYAPNSAYDLQRIVVQHMDALVLRYPDDSFDGIFSCGSLEHFGEWDAIVTAGKEMFRVLKPGGVASIATEFRISGEGDGWDGVKLFDRDRILNWIEATGFELVDNPSLELEVDEETLATTHSLEAIVIDNQWPEVEGVLQNAQYTFTSVHLALRKPDPNAEPVEVAPKPARKPRKTT